MNTDHYLPVALSALTVLILGCWNPDAIQLKDNNGEETGRPNYMWLALLSLLVGMLCVWFCTQKK